MDFEDAHHDLRFLCLLTLDLMSCLVLVSQLVHILLISLLRLVPIERFLL